MDSSSASLSGCRAIVGALRSPANQNLIWQNPAPQPTEVVLKKLAGDDSARVADQIRARKTAEKKLPRFCAHRLLLNPRGVQQASSEAAASWRAQFLHGKRLLDATAGTGVDLLSCAHNFTHIDAVEPDPMRFALLENNLTHLGIKHIRLHHCTLEHFLSNSSSSWDWILIDPDRRDADQKRHVALHLLQPNIIELIPRLRTRCGGIWIKLSPLSDPTQLYREIAPGHIGALSVQGECKEIFALYPPPEAVALPRCAWVFSADGARRLRYWHLPQVTRSEQTPFSTEPEDFCPEWIAKADPTLIKMEEFRAFCDHFNLLPLGSHWCAVQQLHPKVPPLHWLKVEHCEQFTLKKARRSLKHLGISAAGLSCQATGLSALKCRKDLGLRNQGQKQILIWQSPGARRSMCIAKAVPETARHRTQSGTELCAAAWAL